uniref:LysR family transcriptional regulator n=1 Tax=uncultured Sphingomonas sp. TaxID=158754 RepID=UPI0035CC763F
MRVPDHFNALRAVEAAARHQSFALAVQELSVTPAAIGQLVRRLEETLGVSMFHRAQSGPARLVATEAAKAAIPELQEGFPRLAAAMDRLRFAGTRRSLSVTVPMAFADKWLLYRLDGFREQHPECELRIDTSTALVDSPASRSISAFDTARASGRALSPSPSHATLSFPSAAPRCWTA